MDLCIWIAIVISLWWMLFEDLAAFVNQVVVKLYPTNLVFFIHWQCSYAYEKHIMEVYFSTSRWHRKIHGNWSDANLMVGIQEMLFRFTSATPDWGFSANLGFKWWCQISFHGQSVKLWMLVSGLTIIVYSVLVLYTAPMTHKHKLARRQTRDWFKLLNL